MPELHIDRWKSKPFAHQIDGVNDLMTHKSFGLMWEMGCGKSKCVVDSACELFLRGEVNSVLVVAPASVRSVWIGEDFGEVKKHSWVSSAVIEYHNPRRVIWQDKNPELFWFVTNYEYLRSTERQKELLEILQAGHFKTMMVLDESSYVKSRTAAQTKACMKIGEKIDRKVILNGTPISNNPLDLWSQMQFLDKGILPYANFYAFRATFARIYSRHGFPKILGWQNMELLQRQVAPFVVRREKKDCIDLPEKIYTTREVALTEDTWKVYREMREEAIVWLNENPSLAAQAGVKMIRLCQIVNGFLGGFQASEEDPEPQAVEIGREKLNILREYITSLLESKPNLKIIVWGRFRRELERIYTEMVDLIPTYILYGGQSHSNRTTAINKFSVVKNDGPALLAAQEQAGGLGLNLVAADHVVYTSHGFSLMTRLQSENRTHRPGQKNNVLYLDLIATGPRGEKTIDHIAVKALRSKGDLATWIVSDWKKALTCDVEEAA